MSSIKVFDRVRNCREPALWILFTHRAALFWVGRKQLATRRCRENEKDFSADENSSCFQLVGYFFNSGMVIAMFKATTGNHTILKVIIPMKENNTMELTTSKKKIMLATILTTSIALAISQAALAQPADAGVQGKDTPPCQSQMDPATQKARDKFLTETVELRKQLAEKNAAMQAVLNAGTPDTDKASKLAGELFEIREKLRAKGQESGLPMPMLMMGHGDMGGMPCQGMGEGKGKGHHGMK